MLHQTALNKAQLPVGVAFGTSIVEFMTGIAPSSYTPTGINNHSWSGINVARQLFSGVNLDTWHSPSAYTKMTGANQGRSGEALVDALPRIKAFDKRHLSFYIFDYGINDFWIKGRTAAQFGGDLSRALDSLDKVPLGFVCNIRMPRPEHPNFPLGDPKRTAILQANDLIEAEVAARGLVLVDVFRIYEEALQNPYFDNLHPNAYGAHLEGLLLESLFRGHFANLPGTPATNTPDNLMPRFTGGGGGVYTGVSGTVMSGYHIAQYEGNASVTARIDYPQPDGTLAQVIEIRSATSNGRISLWTSVLVPAMADRWMQVASSMDILAWEGWRGYDIQLNGYAAANTLGHDCRLPNVYMTKNIATEVFPMSVGTTGAVVWNFNYAPASGTGYLIIRQPYFGEAPDPRLFRGGKD